MLEGAGKVGERQMPFGQFPESRPTGRDLHQIKFNPNAEIHGLSALDSSELYRVRQQEFLGSYSCYLSQFRSLGNLSKMQEHKKR